MADSNPKAALSTVMSKMSETMTVQYPVMPLLLQVCGFISIEKEKGIVPGV